MISVPPDTLSRTPEEGARIIILRLLDDARAALSRMDDSSDDEALHDFRVGLRRLRSSMRAYLPYLRRAEVKRGLRRARELASRTNPARDLEVQIEWLEAHRQALARSLRPALNHLVRELHERSEWARHGALDGVKEDFERIDSELRASHTSFATVIHIDGKPSGPSFASAAAELLRTQTTRLILALESVASPYDEEHAHRARIQAKRVRYLLEPFVKHVDNGRALLRRLKGLQDILGEFNDLRVLIGSLTATLEETALLRARAQLDAVLGNDPESARRLQQRALENGLLAIAKLVNARKQELFEVLESKWLGEPSTDFFEQLGRFAAALEGSDADSVEIERKYLLDALPAVCQTATSVLIEQGWLPGKKVRERLRRVRGRDGERFVRTVKLGSGVKRAEFEEPVSRPVFEQLWPLTEGCRVIKRRYKIPAGELTWEIDEFLDRDLVLAEIELPHVDTEVELPDWLAPALVREVTDEDEFTNLRLAR